MLAVIPVEEEEGEGAHDKEEEDPYSEAGIVFYGLVTEERNYSYKPNEIKLACSKNWLDGFVW